MADLDLSNAAPSSSEVPVGTSAWLSMKRESVRANVFYGSVGFIAVLVLIMVISVIADWLPLDDALKMGGIFSPLASLVAVATAFYFEKS